MSFCWGVRGLGFGLGVGFFLGGGELFVWGGF